jgi:hypothetical protein
MARSVWSARSLLPLFGLEIPLEGSATRATKAPASRAHSKRFALIKGRVQRINAEIKKIPGAHIWVTEAKEIESYAPGLVLQKVFELESVPDPGQYDVFFPLDDSAKKGASFVECHLKRKGIDKMDLAVQAAPHMTKEQMGSDLIWHRRSPRLLSG